MTTSPSGPMSLAKQRAKVLLASSATWRTWTSSADATTALETIHLDALPPPASGHQYMKTELQNYRPYAIVGTDRGGFSKRKYRPCSA